jgi:hypothetical protein
MGSDPASRRRAAGPPRAAAISRWRAGERRAGSAAGGRAAGGRVGGPLAGVASPTLRFAQDSLSIRVFKLPSCQRDREARARRRERDPIAVHEGRRPKCRPKRPLPDAPGGAGAVRNGYRSESAIRVAAPNGPRPGPVLLGEARVPPEDEPNAHRLTGFIAVPTKKVSNAFRCNGLERS